MEDLAGNYEALRHAGDSEDNDRAAVTFPSNFDRVVDVGDVATGGRKRQGPRASERQRGPRQRQQP